MDTSTLAQTSTDGRDDVRGKMYTGDLYRNMEVSIHEGDAKMHCGVVQGTRVKDGRAVVDVLTSTRTINTVIALDALSVTERKYVCCNLRISTLTNQLQHWTTISKGTMATQRLP
jgi:hypothetical protein